MPNYEPTLDEAKLAALAQRAASAANGDPLFNEERLAATLWLADFTAYATHGASITGASYVHRPQGPAIAGADDLLALAAGTSAGDPFDDREREIADHAIATFAGKAGSEASSAVRAESVGWRLAGAGELIPYETVYLPSEPPWDADVEWAHAELDRIRRERATAGAGADFAFEEWWPVHVPLTQASEPAPSR